MTDATAQQGFERRRAPKRRALQRAIIEAAQRLLEHKDAAALSIEDIAAEAKLSTDTVAECFRSMNELLLSLAAHQLAGLARATYAEGTDERQWMAASSGALSVLRAAKQILGTPAENPASAADDGDDDEAESEGEVEVDASSAAAEQTAAEAEPAARPEPAVRRHNPASITPELGQLLTELTSDEGAKSTAASLTRLERRLSLIERNLGERPAQTSRDKANASVLVDPSVNNLGDRMKVLEKQQSEVATELRAAIHDLGGRVQLLEAIPPAEAKEQAKKRRRDETDFPDAPLTAMAAETPQVDGDDDSQAQKPVDEVLAAARRAAREAAAKAQAPDKKHHAGGLGKTMSSVLGLQKPGGRKRLMLASLVPVSIVVLAFFAGYYQAVQASRASVVTPPEPVVTVTEVAPELERLIEMASRGNAGAELLLGLKYLNGEGVARDEAEAFHWLQKSSEHGQAVAQYWLGTLHTREKSANADPAKALEWYEAAAKQGNRMAMNNLAVAYAQGLGTPKNLTQAARWFAEAAKLGYAVSQFNLAVLYERGEGVPQNLVEAYKWYAVAAALGDGEAKKRIATMASELKPEQLSIAQAAAKAFQPVTMNQAANFAPQFSALALQDE